jgi:cellulose synthase operon protein C
MLGGAAPRARKDWPAALAAYRKAEQLNAASPPPNGTLAIALHSTLVESGRADEAARFANAWTERHKEDAIFKYHLGDVALARGQFAQAEQQYQAVLALTPDNAAAVNNMAWLRLRAGKTDDALKFAQQANERRCRPRARPTRPSACSRTR